MSSLTGYFNGGEILACEDRPAVVAAYANGSIAGRPRADGNDFIKATNSVKSCTGGVGFLQNQAAGYRSRSAAGKAKPE